MMCTKYILYAHTIIRLVVCSCIQMRFSLLTININIRHVKSAFSNTRRSPINYQVKEETWFNFSEADREKLVQSCYIRLSRLSQIPADGLQWHKIVMPLISYPRVSLNCFCTKQQVTIHLKDIIRPVI